MNIFLVLDLLSLFCMPLDSRAISRLSLLVFCSLDCHLSLSPASQQQTAVRLDCYIELYFRDVPSTTHMVITQGIRLFRHVRNRNGLNEIRAGKHDAPTMLRRSIRVGPLRTARGVRETLVHHKRHVRWHSRLAEYGSRSNRSMTSQTPKCGF